MQMGSLISCCFMSSRSFNVQGFEKKRVTEDDDDNESERNTELNHLPTFSAYKYVGIGSIS